MGAAKWLNLGEVRILKWICNQQVGGSNPPAGSNDIKRLWHFAVTVFLLWEAHGKQMKEIFCLMVEPSERVNRKPIDRFDRTGF